MLVPLVLMIATLPPGMQEAIDARGLQRFDEATDLVTIATRADEYRLKLIPAAAEQWHAMNAAARDDGVELIVVSAFRSIAHQQGIIDRKVAAGQTVEQILSVSAPPGYSEHHTGRALDLATPGSRALEEEFEDTDAFRWLEKNAHRFGFRLSYPRGNPEGYSYEPWHWAWHPDAP